MRGNNVVTLYIKLSGDISIDTFVPKEYLDYMNIIPCNGCIYCPPKYIIVKKDILHIFVSPILVSILPSKRL